ncbi:MAG: hypothetical protein HUJ13_07760 [Hydrogenovibrio crunogenus]|uniref:Lipoprotein n=1 Tax=Hydrogenovibrio crunogenus (strain DSM 25203 / XCL-2) TaxID=317025 RepID=Q31FV0_HYDCU|nr:hypothetical protein [Hydrogenovibrio crunogenus]
MKAITKIVMTGLVVMLAGCSGVQTKEVGKDVYYLTNFYNEPPRSFSSWSMESQADSLCPMGYDVLSKNAGKSGEFGYNDFACAAGQSCDYVLEWRIRCSDKPKQETSIFGKT